MPLISKMTQRFSKIPEKSLKFLLNDPHKREIYRLLCVFSYSFLG